MAQTRAFHAMAKPSGPDCNLRCAYCYYLEKEALYPSDTPRRMNHATLEAYVQNYIACSPEGAAVSFTWQGGEPALSGIDFYRQAVLLQRRYDLGRTISNSFQTNGVLLSDEWCKFLKTNNFFVGLSLDGPADVHDAYRKTENGEPSHHLVMRALRLLQKHGIEYNILACVNRRNYSEPGRVYNFFKDAGVRFIQFQPVVERDADGNISDYSVPPESYGQFLAGVFDIWVRNDVGAMYVMNFEWALANYINKPGAACHHRPTCGRSVVVEHNGDVYPCDHYVTPGNLLGNINNAPFSDMLDTNNQEKFGTRKHDSLPASCRKCPVLRACFGGCQRHRTPQDAKNYLCGGLLHFFTHIAPYLQVMKRLIDAGNPVSRIMDAQIVIM